MEYRGAQGEFKIIANMDGNNALVNEDGTICTFSKRLAKTVEKEATEALFLNAKDMLYKLNELLQYDNDNIIFTIEQRTSIENIVNKII